MTPASADSMSARPAFPLGGLDTTTSTIEAQLLAQARWRVAEDGADGPGHVAVVGEADCGGDRGELVPAGAEALKHFVDAWSHLAPGRREAGGLAKHLPQVER